MLWLAHGTPNLVLVNIQVSLPIGTLAILLWSARRFITRLERVIVIGNRRLLNYNGL
jgi:hypothetical protein